MMRLTPSRFMFALLLVAVAIMLQAPEAFAIGDDISTANFSCSGSTASGQLFVSGTGCPTTLSMDNVFSFLVCNFEQLSSNVMGAMYCGMVSNLAPAVMAAVTLATVIYGIMFTFGMIPAKGEDAIKFLLKCAFVIAFATDSDYLIGIAYRGALAAMSGGASIAIGLMSSDVTSATASTTTAATTITSGADIYSQLDGFLSTIFHDATDYLTDPTKVTTDNSALCKNAIFAVLGTMFVVFPFLAYMGLVLVGRILMTFFRAVFAYIYAVVGITFILLLAPFFVSFALFKVTSNLFDRWLGYLVSFTLQVVLLFSFLAFIFSMHLQNTPAITNLTALIMYNSENAETTGFRMPFSYCTLCDFKVVNATTGAAMTDSDPNYIAQGKMVCADHSGDSPAPANMVSMPVTTTDSSGNTTSTTVSAIPIRPTFATSPNSTGQLGALLSLAGNNILSLIILVLVIEHLLKIIPEIAQLAASSMGATYATQLGGGDVAISQANVLNMPGTSVVQNFSQGFQRGFGGVDGGSGFSGNSIQRTADGVKDGLGTARQGLGGMLGNFLTDPSQFGQ